MRERRPNAAAEALLFAVSTRCAYPDCPEPTVKLTADRRADKKVQAAHIVPVSSTMPRWRPMDPAERENYLNLVLLCKAHHELVDKSPIAHDFTETDLRKWKEEAEHELREKLDGIDRYTFTEVQDMISLATERGTEVIMSSIGELGTKVDSPTAKVLTVLYEQFTDKRRDHEVAAMLYTVSERLGSGAFTEAAHTFSQTTRDLGNFHEDVTRFQAATKQLNEVNPQALISLTEQAGAELGALQRNGINTGPDTRELSHAVARQVAAILDAHDDRRQNPEPQRPAPAPKEPSFDTKHVFLTGLGLVSCCLSCSSGPPSGSSKRRRGVPLSRRGVVQLGGDATW